MRTRIICVILYLLMMQAISFAAEMRQNSEKSISKAPYYQKQDALVLRSRDFHNGNYKWQIIKDSAFSDSGDRISLAGYTSEAAMDAIMPGTVLNTLVYNKVYPEPYFGLNNARELSLIPDITEVGRDFYTYWFRTEFELTSAFTGKQVMMRFDGINYRAEIWLNGQNLGNMAGMFQRGFFDITDVVNYQGPNALAVLVRPVDVLGGFENKFKEARAVGENRNGGDGTIGKNVTQLMSVGWDFTFSDGIRDRNTGIWKDITIFPVASVELRNPFIKSDLSMPAMTSSRQDITVEAMNQTETSQTGVLRAVIEDMGVDIEKTVNLGPHETRTVHFSPDEYESLTCRNPKLWWPIHKGPQNLYSLTLTFRQNGQVGDTEKTRFAVRHVTSDRNTPDQSRQFYINGKPIFLHGTNWIPEAMLRKTDERMYAQLRYTQQAGINFIRFWAGGIVESDYFYDLCDELGIMVSMEFWLTGDTDLPSDFDLYRANFTDTIKTLRNHPCIIYYISANERSATSIVPVVDLVDSLDGTRGYQAGSEIDGIHDGSPYKYVNPMFYYDDSASDRGSRIYGMCPEYGTPCLPTLDCLEEMMDAGDIWPINETVWNYHDGGGFHDMILKYVPAMQQYGPISSAEELVWKGQMVGAVGYRSIWECWTYNRQNNGDRFTTGVWFWYHNSPARQVCGRMWDWSLEPTAALYYSQDAHEPIHAQYDFLKNTVSVNNEFYTPFQGSVRMRVFNKDMTLKYERQTAVTVGSDTVANDVIQAQLPSGLSGVHFIRLDVADANDKPVADTFYWRSNNEYQGKTTYTGPLYAGFGDIEKLPKVAISSTFQKQDGKYRVTLKNPSQALAFMIRVKLADPVTQKPIRPSFYTDNFFSLLPGEEKTITIEPYEPVPSAVIIVTGWNVMEATMPIQDAPPVTSGLVMHLDADAITDVIDSDTIGTWPDLSGSGNDAVQNTSGIQPIYVADSTASGKSAVRFDGSDDFLDLNGNMITVGSFTLFAVGRFDATQNSGNHYMVGAQTTGDKRLQINWDQSTNPDKFGWCAGNSANLPSWSPLADTDPHVFVMTSQVSGYMDGTCLGTSANTAAVTPAGLNLGRQPDGAGSQFFKGDIAEVIIYNRVLNAIEMDQVGGYLSQKYPTIDTDYNNYPYDPGPVNGATGVLPAVALTWKAGLDPDDLTRVNPAVKKHYLWMSNGNPADMNLSLVTSIDITDYADPAADGSFVPAPELNYDSTYYWKIEEGLDNGAGGTYPAGDPHNLFGPIWSFQTIATILEITAQPVSVKANPAATAEFNIGYSSVSAVTGVTWYKNGTPLSAGGDITIAWDQTSSTLSIANADSGDEAEYYAVVTNSGGDSDQTDRVRLLLNKLLAWYRFEQNAADSAGTNNGTVIGGINYTAGPVTDGGQAYAADPDGTNYVLLSTDAYPKAGFGNGLDAFTYSCWVKLAPGQGGIILGVFNNGQTTGLRFSINSAENDISVYLRQEGGASIGPRTSVLATDNQWHFVAATYSGSDMKIYVDGTWRTTATNTLTNFAAWQYPMTIVAVNSRGSINNRFSGQVDDLKIYNYALTGVDIAQEYLVVEGGYVCDLEQDELVYDFDGNCQVDLGDLVMFAATWLDGNRVYAR